MWYDKNEFGYIAAMEGVSHMTKAQSYKDKAYHYLKERIDNNILLPNTHLKEIDIAERLGMSRTPVRKAMAQLEEEGYVRIEPYKGAKVTKSALNSTAIVERLQFIELMAIHLFQHMQGKDILVDEKQMNYYTSRIAKHLENKDFEAYFQTEFNFFHFIVSYHSNSYFRQVTLNTIQTLHDLYYNFAKRHTEDLNSEVRAIREFYPKFSQAVIAGDYPNARKQVRIWMNHLILVQIN